MTAFINRTGQRFGRLAVLETFKTESGRTSWQCQCDCGDVRFYLASNLVKGANTQSCGCLRSDVSKTVNASHLMSNTKAYRSWCHLKERCDNPTNKAYANYGGRGITYCERWAKFENFYADMGAPPSSKHSIDRYPSPDGNYEPSNCRWATQKEQCANKRNNVWVDSPWGRISLLDAAERTGLQYDTLKQRVQRGVSGAALFAERYRCGG